MTESDKGHTYCTVKQLAADPSFCFTESMLRYYLFHANFNGLAPALRRIGARKILIRRDLFIAWLEGQKLGAQS